MLGNDVSYVWDRKPDSEPGFWIFLHEPLWLIKIPWGIAALWLGSVYLSWSENSDVKETWGVKTLSSDSESRIAHAGGSQTLCEQSVKKFCPAEGIKVYHYVNGTFPHLHSDVLSWLGDKANMPLSIVSVCLWQWAVPTVSTISDTEILELRMTIMIRRGLPRPQVHWWGSRSSLLRY